MDITTKINFYGSKTHVNGRYVNLTGQNVTITDKGLFVNGKPIEEFDDSQLPVIKIEITGNIENLTTENGDITVKDVLGLLPLRTAMWTVRQSRATWRVRMEILLFLLVMAIATRRMEISSAISIKVRYGNKT